MNNKYCRRKHYNLVFWKKGGEGSQVWKRMLHARDLVEHQIWGYIELSIQVGPTHLG